MEPSHPSRGDPADPSSRGLRVSLLAQERALAPMAALAGLEDDRLALNVTALARDDAAPDD